MLGGGGRPREATRSNLSVPRFTGTLMDLCWGCGKKPSTTFSGGWPVCAHCAEWKVGLDPFCWEKMKLVGESP